jgi:hypothetical protein
VDRVFWPRAFGGCHTARDTPAAIAAAGFEVEQQRTMWVNPVPIAFPVAAHAIGRARRSADSAVALAAAVPAHGG